MSGNKKSEETQVNDRGDKKGSAGTGDLAFIPKQEDRPPFLGPAGKSKSPSSKEGSLVTP